MKWLQRITPDLTATDDPGMCLRFVQRVFRNMNPIYYGSAKEAWDGAVFKHPGEEGPNDVAVPVFWSHWGYYGSPPEYKDWGHTGMRYPDGRILTSPITTPYAYIGRQWYPSRWALEADIPLTYLGWAEDVGGARTVSPIGSITPPSKRRQHKMYIVYYANAAPNDKKFKGRWLVVGTPRRAIFKTQAAIDNVARQIGVTNALVIKTELGWKNQLRIAGPA